MSYSPNIAGGNYSGAGDAGALPGLTPTNVGSLGTNIVNSGYVGTIYDFNPFSILRAVHERHNNVSDFRFLLDAFGMSRGVDAPTTGHYERDWHYNTVKFGTTYTSGASAGNGGDAIIGLHADMMFDGSQTASGTPVLSSDVEVGQVLLFYNGVRARVSAKNTTTNPHRLTLTPQKAAEQIPAITSGDAFSIVTNSWSEGAGLPKGKMPRLTKYTNVFQIVKAACGSTGTSLTDQLFVQFKPGVDGNMFAEVSDIMMADFERYNNGALLFSDLSDNITAFVTDLEVDRDVVTTEGMIAWAQTYGHEQEYTVNSYSLADFDAIGKTFNDERIGTRMLMTLDGSDMFTTTENLLYSQFNGDVTPMVMKSMAAQAPQVAGDDWQPFENPNFEFYIGFRGVHKNGFDFAFKNLHEFSDVQGVGSSGYDFRNWRIALPLGGQAINYATGNSGFKWGYEWRQFKNYSRKVVFGTIAGAGPAGTGGYTVIQPSHDYDFMKSYMISEVAYHGACPNQVYIQKPA